VVAGPTHIKLVALEALVAEVRRALAMVLQDKETTAAHICQAVVVAVLAVLVV
tara:strand:- start:609 stop:767 length:159 start_codon:yes stop_codon:yes gene_type:complete